MSKPADPKAAFRAGNMLNKAAATARKQFDTDYKRPRDTDLDNYKFMMQPRVPKKSLIDMDYDS